MNFKNYFDQILFGFEYEVIIDHSNVTDWESKQTSAKEELKSIVENFNNKILTLKNALVNRYILAKLYNDYNRNTINIKLEYLNNNIITYPYLFIVDNGYHLKCCIPKSIETQFQIEKDFSWKISYDDSVEFQYKKDCEKCIFNKNNANIWKNSSRTNIILNNIEIISPPFNILNYSNIFNIFDNTFKNTNLQYYCNKSTSNHVHLSCNDMFKDVNNLYKICVAWFYFEDLFMMLCDSYRRNNEYCVGMKKIITNVPQQNFKDIETLIKFFQGDPHKKNTRQTALNLLNISTLGTIEIRLKESCKDPKELIAWISLLHVFIARVLSKECVTELFTETQKENLSMIKQYKITDKLNVYLLDECKNMFFSFINVNILKKYWTVKYYKNLNITNDEHYNAYKQICAHVRNERENIEILTEEIKDDKINNIIEKAIYNTTLTGGKITVKELKNVAKIFKLKNFSTCNKNDLIKLCNKKFF